MRYIIQPQVDAVLPWLFRKAPSPSAVPLFPENNDKGLVVAYLLNGVCYAEVLPTIKQLRAVCGKGFPFGRLFFQVKKIDLFPACAQLSASSFEGPA
jgi:hypothetical protein